MTDNASDVIPVDMLCHMPLCDGQQGFILRNPYLFQDLFCSVLHHSQLSLDQEQDWMPEAGPRRGHSILLCVTKKSTGTSRDLFFHSMIHRQFLLGFISGASLLLCPFLYEDVGHLMHF